MPRSTDTSTPTSPSGSVAMRLRLVGQMEAWTLTSESILPTGRKTRALMAIIALSAPRPVLRGKLAEMLWSRRPEEQARASLRQEIHRLLDALDPVGNQVLSITRDHLALRPGAVWVDVEELLRASPAKPAALGLYDGELLEGLDGIDPAFDNWLHGERERLSDRARTLAELLLRDQTEPETMVAAAQQLLRIDRAHEGAWRALMRAYVARGERGMAIQAYERCRLVLADQLDAQPSAETQRLLADIRSAIPPRLVPGQGAEPPAAGMRPGLARPPPRIVARSGGNGALAEEVDEALSGLMGRAELRGEPGRDGGYRDAGLRDPGGRDPGGRDPGGRDPGGRDPGGRDPGMRDPGAGGPGGGNGQDRGGSGWSGGGEPGRPQAAASMGHPPAGTPPAAPRAAGFAEAAGAPPIGREATRPAMQHAGLRVGVLPLQLIGTTEAESFLSVGLADEITSALARFRGLVLVASGSLGRSLQPSRDEATLPGTPGLDFVLDGSVQRGGNRLRVTMRLLDLRAGNRQVWSGRFEHDAGDLLTLQDEVAAEVAARIDAEIMQAEAARLAARPPGEPSANDMVLRALPLLTRLERPLFVQAGQLLHQAVLQEPDWAASHAWHAFWHVLHCEQGWAEDRAAAQTEAGRLAERAMALDGQDARALTIAGHVRAALERRASDGLRLHERALGLNPNLAMAWGLSAAAFAYLGEVDEAERRHARYKRLSPADPQAHFLDSAMVLTALIRRDHAGAVAIGREVTSLSGACVAALTPYLAALGHLGAAADAAAARERLLAIEPSVSVATLLEASPLQREADRAHLAEGLHLAGLED